MSDIKVQTIKGEDVIEGEDLNFKCACGREEFEEEEVTMIGSNYAYILCSCDRLLRVEWDDGGYNSIFIGEVGSASEYTKERMGEE